ncbi:hypothetical protein YC2023_084392 [Brassica napus]
MTETETRNKSYINRTENADSIETQDSIETENSMERLALTLCRLNLSGGSWWRDHRSILDALMMAFNTFYSFTFCIDSSMLVVFDFLNRGGEFSGSRIYRFFVGDLSKRGYQRHKVTSSRTSLFEDHHGFRMCEVKMLKRGRSLLPWMLYQS